MGALCRDKCTPPNMSSAADFKHDSQHVKSRSGIDVVDREQSQQQYTQRMVQTQIQTLTSLYSTLNTKKTWVDEAHLMEETSDSGA
jgi:hypothetical protein